MFTYSARAEPHSPSPKATIDFETTPQFVLQVKAQDYGSPSNSRTQNITVNVTNLNEAPVFLAPTTFSVMENAANGANVGLVWTVDPESQAVTYSITGGNTNTAFAINAATGQLTVNNSAALDFETTPQFLLSVKAQDNGSPSNSRTQIITINLTDISGAGLPAKASPSRGMSLTAASYSGEQSASGAEGLPFRGKRPVESASSTELSFWLDQPLPSDAPTADNPASN